MNGLVQGDHNTVNMTYNLYGALATPENGPGPQLVLTATKLLPAPFADLVDRTEPSAQLLEAIRKRSPCELSGQEGIGKSALLRTISRQVDLTVFTSGIVYLEQRGQPVEDLLQLLFSIFYDAPSGFKPVGGRLLRYLQDINALVLIDDLALSRDDADRLRNCAPNCTFVMADELSEMTEGAMVQLAGLPEADARILLERRLKRPLSADEQPAAHDIWTSVGGNPLLLIQAAALVDGGQTTVVALAQKLQLDGPSQLGTEAIAACTTDEKQLLATLASLGDSAVAQTHIAAIAGQPDAAAKLRSLADRGLVQSHSPSFTAVNNVAGALPREASATLERVVNWASGAGSKEDLVSAAPLIQHAMGMAADAGRWQDVFKLSRAIETELAASGRWGAWKSVLNQALTAARKEGSLADEGWALHQLGTRSLGLEDFGPARDLLTQALKARRVAGDAKGTEATEHNLASLRTLEIGEQPANGTPKKLTGPKGGGSPPWGLITGVALTLLVAASGGVAYAVDPNLIGSLVGQPSSAPTPTPPSSPSPVVVLPTITRAVPSKFGQGATVKIDFSGTGFEAGMTVDLGPGIQLTGIVVNSSSDLISAASVAQDAAPGQRNAVFTTRDGRRATCTDCITITPGPFISDFVPKAAGQGATARLIVSSPYLTDKTQLRFSGGGLSVARVAINVQTGQLTGILSVTAAAPPGPRDLSLTNPGDGGTYTCHGCMLVTPAPTIQKASPGSITYGGPTLVQFFGSGFAAGVSVQFPGGNISIDSISFINSTEIDLKLTVSQYAAQGLQTLTVTNSDGGRSQCSDCLSVYSNLQ